MNYLAHLYLSGDSEALLIGNFIGDSVRGVQLSSYSEGIRNGVLLHRKIDTFTDAHPIVEESKKRLREKYRKYAGVIVDIYYDHFLARDWANYSAVPLKEYASHAYAIIRENHHLLPEKAKMFFHYMQSRDILNAYASMEGVEKVLYGMSRRASFNSGMEKAAKDLQVHYRSFEEEFRLFFPELKQYALTALG